MNYLCFTVIPLLCHLYRRSQPVFVKDTADHQAYVLCDTIRTISLYSPLKFLHGITDDTIPIIVGRCIGFGYSSHCCITNLHNISDPLYRFHSYRYIRCFGACNSTIFRSPPVSRKTDSTINGRHFNDYHCRYLDYPRQVAYKKDEYAVAGEQKIIYFC